VTIKRQTNKDFASCASATIVITRKDGGVIEL
jgi:hypothetical protein